METFVGDTPKIVMKTGIDLTPYGSLYIKYRKPDGSVGIWDATLSTDDDEWMEYQLTESDLDLAGTWALQAHAESPGVSLHGLWAEITVYNPTSDVVIV